VHTEPDALVVSVDDDGDGLNGSTSVLGVGLSSMRQRVHSLGGELCLVTSPLGGTRVCARLPLAGTR
jgi:signal transduction histidine kinase